MRYLRIYENFPPLKLGEPSKIDKIHEFIRNHKLYKGEYHIGYDKESNQYYLDVDGYIDISHKKLEKIPIKFGKIGDTFDCRKNNLKTLENSPNYVVGHFDCSFNHLTNFVGGPIYVDGGYICHNNNITNMKGFPVNYKRAIYIGDNPVVEILYLPSRLEGFLIDKYRYQRFIELLNEYDVIRGTDIIQDRLEEALYYIGVRKEIQETDLEFKNYRVI